MHPAALPRILFMLMFAMSAHAQEAQAPPREDTSEPTDAGVPVDTAPPDLFARDTYRLDPILCPFRGDIDYEPGHIDCFLLEVPENREKPDSRMIELHVIRLNARTDREVDEDMTTYADGVAAGERDDPVVYLTGGPGAHATYYVNRFKDHTLLHHRDLYILEQRGIGYSDDFCPAFFTRKPADDNVATFAEYIEVQFQNFADCAINARAAGVDLEGYNTIENARDVKALRRALGFEDWNVWGISYGSILGQAYLKEDPDGIRAIAIDAIMPLEIRGSDEYWRVIKWYVRDLEKLQAICDAQPECAEHYPDMLGRIRSAVQSVRDNPIAVEVEDIEAYPGGKAYIFDDIVALLPFSLFYEQSNYPGLPGLIYAWADAVERRDDTLFSAIAAFMSGGDNEQSAGMQNAILCADGDAGALAGAGRLDLEEFPVLGGVLGNVASLDRRAGACDSLGMTVRDPDQYRAVTTDIPALIIEGDMDPITPPPNAQAILPGFENGTYVEFAYAGHGPSRSVKCAGYMLNEFFDDPAAPPDLTCAEDMEAPDIWAPFYRTRIAPKLALLAADDPKRLAMPGAWAGIPMVMLVIAFLVLTFAPIVRWADGRSAARAGTARFWAWVTSGVSVGGVAVIGAAAAATADASEVYLMFGLVPWGRWGAWLILAGGVLGLLLLITAFRSRSSRRLPFGAFSGFVLTGIAAVALAVFAWHWGLGPL